MKIKLSIIGSRDFSDYDMLKREIGHVPFDITLIISGGAKGADTLGERYADENNIPKRIIKPEWEKYGKSAGFRRNKDIINACDYVVAFWDGVSKGTKNSIDLAKKLNKYLVVHEYDY